MNNELEPSQTDSTAAVPPFEQHPLLAKLSRSLAQAPTSSLQWVQQTVTLVLGSDEEIGGAESPELRVGITPQHVEQLIRFFRELGISLRVRVVHNAGARAGWPDTDYERVGAEIIRREDIRPSQTSTDVLHALKEPSLYEADFFGPYLRIGALHGGDFHPDSGLAKLLARRDVALFDGSATGAPDKFRVPIRGSMSAFAGMIAAEWIVTHFSDRSITGSVVIVGGGGVGSACARKLAATGLSIPITVCEASETPDRFAGVAAALASVPALTIVGIEGLDHPNFLAALKEAAAVVFAPAKHTKRAPRIASVPALRTHLRDHAIIIDVSIDERGAIQDDDAREDWSSEELVPWLKERLLPISYQGISNMPRAYPREASQVHGEVVLPYLGTLLYLSARYGGVNGVLEHLQQIPVNPSGDDPLLADDAAVLAALIQDLRNGLAVCPTPTGLEIADTMPEPDRLAIRALLDGTLPLPNA